MDRLNNAEAARTDLKEHSINWQAVNSDVSHRGPVDGKEDDTVMKMGRLC